MWASRGNLQHYYAIGLRCCLRACACACACAAVNRTVSGQIDQVNQLFYISPEIDGGERYTALSNWSKQLTKLFNTVSNKLA